jgi:zinc transport system ATP-binding protein
MPVNVIEVKDLTVHLQETEALSSINFTIEKGDYIGIVGPNGSGKTTLVRSLLGLLPMVSGEVRFFGQALASFREWTAVGYLPQKGTAIDPRFPATAREVVASGILVRKPFPSFLSAAEKNEINEALKSLNIVDIADQRIGKLSGGQQQRVLLARAFSHRPTLLILDEPAAALDPQTRDSFYSTLEHLNREHQVTVLLVSHDINTIGQYASKLMYLDRKLVFFGKFDEFCRSTVMTDYFGRSTQHVICHRH